MTEKLVHQRISDISRWLDQISVHDETTSPPAVRFEKTEETLGALELLKENNEEAEKLGQKLSQQLQRALDWYYRTTEHLDKSMLPFQQYLLRLRRNPAFVDKLSILTEFYSNLPDDVIKKFDHGCVDFDGKAYSIASMIILLDLEIRHKLTALISDCRCLEEKQQKLSRYFDPLVKNHQNEEEKSEHFRITACKNQDIEVLRQKCVNDQKEVDKLDSELSSTGASLDPNLSAKVFKADEKRIEDLRKEMKDLKSALDRYRDLPPDIDLVRSKVEEAKKKLDSMKSKLSNQLTW